jgi:hypothetical protein
LESRLNWRSLLSPETEANSSSTDNNITISGSANKEVIRADETNMVLAVTAATVAMTVALLAVWKFR